MRNSCDRERSIIEKGQILIGREGGREGGREAE